MSAGEKKSSSNGIAVESAHVKRYWRGKAYTHGCSAIFLLSLGASTVFSYDTIIITQGRVAGSSSGKVARDGGVAVEYYGGHADKSRRDLRFERKSSVAKSRRALGTT